MPFGPDTPSPQPSYAQPTPNDLSQIQSFMGLPPGSYSAGSTAGTTADAGLPSGFVQQVDLALRRKLGARYSELTPDQISSIAQALWNQTNGVAKEYYQQNPFPTSNQSLINQYLFSPSSALPDLARTTIAMLPPNEMTTADRRFLTSAGGSTSLLQMAEMAGFQGDAAVTIAAIAMAESGGNPNALNQESGANGILQFMPATWQGLVDQGQASGDPTDPLAAFEAAYALSQGGTNFSDWETFTNGTYQQYMDPNLLGFPIAGYSQSTADISQDVPFPFNPIYASDVTESHAEGDPGIDYGMPVGQPITTPVAGVVSVKTYAPGHGMVNEGAQQWGRAVFIRTQGGYTFYVGHLGPGVQVTNGQVVQPGQVLGVSGGDPNDPEGLGGFSSGPHVELGWIDPQGNFTDPTALLNSIFGGTTFAALQSQYNTGNVLGTGVATTSAQQQQLLGYDPMLESIYGPIANSLEQYLGRRPLANEIRQVAQLGLNSEQLKQYINSLSSHIPGMSYGTYQLLQQQAGSEFSKLFGYQVPDSVLSELFQKGAVTPSAINLYLAQQPANEIAQRDPAGFNAAYNAAKGPATGVWNDQPHPGDLANIYKQAQQQGYQPPAPVSEGAGGGSMLQQ
jgi:murein DD-endopeptidase MepM/ murein hydrolase activator NlpD